MVDTPEKPAALEFSIRQFVVVSHLGSQFYSHLTFSTPLVCFPRLPRKPFYLRDLGRSVILLFEESLFAIHLPPSGL
jgi:hypothetical protein